MLRVKVNLGNAELTMDGDGDLQDFVRQAGILLEAPKVCGLCDGKEILVQTRVSKDGNKFTEYYCTKCGGRRPWGKYKDGSGFFLKAWEAKYQKPTEE